MKQNTSGKFILPGGLKLQWGKVLLNYVSPYACVADITFPEPYTNEPSVFFCANMMNSEQYWNQVCGFQNIGNTRICTAVVMNPDGEFSEDIRAWVNWFAIGY